MFEQSVPPCLIRTVQQQIRIAWLNMPHIYASKPAVLVCSRQSVPPCLIRTVQQQDQNRLAQHASHLTPQNRLSWFVRAISSALPDSDRQQQIRMPWLNMSHTYASNRLSWFVRAISSPCLIRTVQQQIRIAWLNMPSHLRLKSCCPCSSDSTYPADPPFNMLINQIPTRDSSCLILRIPIRKTFDITVRRTQIPAVSGMTSRNRMPWCTPKPAGSYRPPAENNSSEHKPAFTLLHYNKYYSILVKELL